MRAPRRHGASAAHAARRAGRHRAVAQRRARRRTASRACRSLGPVADRQRLQRPRRRGRWTKADIRRIQADWVKRRGAGARRRLRHRLRLRRAHRTCLGQFLSPYYNQRTRRVRRLAGEPRAVLGRDCWRAVRDAVGRDCAIACAHRRRSAAGGAGVQLDEGLEFIRLADRLVDLWDVHVGSITEWSVDSGVVALLPARAGSSSGRARCGRRPSEADRRRRAPHERRPDGRDRPLGRLGHHRRRAAVDRRPVPAAEDRRGAARTTSASASAATVCISRATAHGHIGCTQNATAGEEYRRGWHPERFQRAANARARRARRRGRAGRHGVRDRARQARRRDACTLVDGRRARSAGIMRWVPRLPGPAASGAGARLAADPAGRSCGTSRSSSSPPSA